jgi:hypothetical protein
MEKDEIRTSCLRFGDAYNENILGAMSKVGQGQLHDADSPNDREAQLLSPPDQYDIAPRAAKALAVALPMPEVPPKMRTILLRNCF